MIKELLRFVAVVAGLLLAVCGVVWWADSMRPDRQWQSSSATAASAVARIPAVFTSQITGMTASTSGTATDPAAPNSSEAMTNAGVAAKVNGEAISRDEVDAGIPADLIGSMVDEVRQTRLERLIASLAIRQYLTQQGVEVPGAAVEATIADLRKNPPPSGGCPCCSYSSLDGFLAANFMSTKDLRDSIRNELGMTKHVDALWNAEYPAGPERDKFVSGQRPRVERTYMRMSHIFFKTVQQPDFAEFPNAVRAKAKAKAMDAWRRLQKGEDFATLAGKLSEDSTSRSKGGNLGCLPKSTFGKDVQNAYESAKPGDYTPPVESPWGVHVVRCERLTKEDMVEVLRTEYRNRKELEILFVHPDKRHRAAIRIDVPTPIHLIR